MKKIYDVINKNGINIITPLIMVIFLNTCGTNGKIKSLNNDVVKMEQKIDSLKLEISNEITIEGLKVEKRMIQSTDRTILDVSRQSEIDKELSKLQK